MHRHHHRDIPLQDSSEAHALTDFSEFDRDLDDYDRALLAEPQSQFQLSDGDRPETIASGRPPISFRPQFQQRRGQNQRQQGTGNRSLALPRSKISQFTRTPPNPVTASSSTGHGLSSSPLLDASQRHSQRQLARTRPNSPEHSAIKKPTSRLDIVSGNVDRESVPCKSNGNHLVRSPQSESSIGMTQAQISLPFAPPVVQGIPLRSLSELPDRLRAVFPFDPFNAIQSKCFAAAYQSRDNLVVAAPTGGGKTAIFELAICNLVSNLSTDQYKIVYMAPTKSLCSERCRDWQTKFAHLDLTCAELTGDTESVNLKSVQSASVLITTPEKWDSMTRQWKDQARLMQLVKLFLIDEVHILRESRGATLECVVSRMKSVGSKVRFVALSATVPNSHDVAVWLGKNQDQDHLPAIRETFGEEFRPVTLQKHVMGIAYKGNDFGFDSVCDTRIMDIILKYGRRKPAMIFCMTRKAAATTAKYLAYIWASKDSRDRPWPGPTQKLAVGDTDLAQTLSSAVAFHHAGLDSTDRNVVEKGYLNGDVNVICCTSTLAVGINLPCHLVVIKNTLSYQTEGLKEYSDLEIMQMLGRAGRPQFDDSAIGVIVTKQEKAERYKRLFTGNEMLESCLHLNLIDHVNAEIGLGTIYNLQTAKRWLTGTFLYVRLDKNAEHYKLDGIPIQGDLDEKIETVSRRSIEDLEDAGLVISHDKIQATELGKIMARYYVKFATMKTFLGLESRPKISDILSVLVQAEEFEPIRFRSSEKKLLKLLNGNDGTKYPIKVDIALHAHKRSLLVQVELGGIEFPVDDDYMKHKRQYQQDTALLFSNVNRLIRCIIDIQIHRQDAVGTRNALELSRSLEAHAWDNSPFQMKQIKTIGSVAIRKLAMSGVRTIEDLEATEPHRIELLLSRNPPYGTKLISILKDFPKFRVSIKAMSKGSRKECCVEMDVQLEIGFMNERSPAFYQSKPVYICLLTERSDGHLMDFRRISARQLGNSPNVLLTAAFSHPEQYMSCYVMCDAIAGTLRYAEFKPTLPSYLFPQMIAKSSKPVRRSTDTSPATLVDDEFGGEDLSDRELIDIFAGEDFHSIENFEREHEVSQTVAKSKEQQDNGSHDWRAVQLPNGKWACNHKCKDKKKQVTFPQETPTFLTSNISSCKHYCCHEGLDKKPKPPRIEPSGAGPKISRTLDRDKPSPTSVSAEAVSSTRRAESYKRRSPWDTKRLCDPRALDILQEKLIGKQKPTQGKPPAKPQDDDFQLENLHKQQEQPCSSSYQSEDLPSPSALLAMADNTVQAEANLDESCFQGDVDASPIDRRSSELALPIASDKADTKESQHSKEEAGPSRITEQIEAPAFPAKAVSQTESRFFTSSNDCSIATSSFTPINISKRPRVAGSNLDSKGQAQAGPFEDSSSLFAPPPTKRRKPNEPIREPLANPMLPNVAAVEDHSVAIAPAGIDNPPAVEASNAQLPVIKAGYPAWVYDLDPAFVAEWEDLVEFV